MATYNQWMNESIYSAARKLPPSELEADKKAFFGSILGTLNHIAVGDTIWLKRFSNHPANYNALNQFEAKTPSALDEQLFLDIEALYQYRKSLDGVISEWASTITEPDLEVVLNYKSMKGIGSSKNFYSLIMHFFNHQTHHRGQASTLLFQSGIDVGVTDLVAIIPNE
jgi:uncharacterized damage-inducible protein DinB